MELTRTIKRLERLRTDIKSELISKEWNLDNESKVPKKSQLAKLNYLYTLSTKCFDIKILFSFQVFQRITDQKIHLKNQLYHKNIKKENYWQSM